MSNNLKEVMKKEFDKNKNYNEILSKVERVNSINNFKMKYMLAPIFTLVIIIGSFMIFNDTNLINQQGLIDKEDSILDIFTVKVYAAESENTYLSVNYNEETEEKILEPKVELQLASYNQLMSSVPGLPLKIEENDVNNSVDQILVTTDNGEFLTWKQETGEVQKRGKNVSLNDTSILYWTPNLENTECNSYGYEQNIWENSDIKTIGKINISAQKNNEILYEKIVYIGKTNYNYYAILY